MTTDPTRREQAALLGKLCRKAIAEATIPFGSWMLKQGAVVAIAPMENSAELLRYRRDVIEAELDAVAYARRAARVVLT